MPFVSGFLRLRRRGGGPVDPDYGIDEGEGPVDPGFGIPEGGRPGHDLPWAPVRPGQGLPGGGGGPVDPGYGIPLPPVIDNGLPGHPGVWPPQHPTYPVDRPDNSLPKPPHMWPKPPYPPTVWPPPHPVDPDVPMYPERPDNALPLPPGAVYPPLPPEIHGKVMCVVWVVGVGYRWTVLDPSLKPSQPIQPTPEPRRG